MKFTAKTRHFDVSRILRNVVRTVLVFVSVLWEGIDMKSVEELDVFKLAHELALKTYSTTKVFPKEETFSLVDQMRRAATSVGMNLMEGAMRLVAANTGNSNAVASEMLHASFSVVTKAIAPAQSASRFRSCKSLAE